MDSTYPERTPAKLKSPFIQADDPVCLGFAYSMKGRQKDMSHLKVFMLWGIYSRYSIFENNKVTDAEWEEVVVHLGVGVYRFEIEAWGGSGPLGDIAIDDVTVGPCAKFGTYDSIDREVYIYITKVLNRDRAYVGERF